jgi:hypothetical protein
VHPVTALQTEYSIWTGDPKANPLPLLRELDAVGAETHSARPERAWVRLLEN